MAWGGGREGVARREGGRAPEGWRLGSGGAGAPSRWPGAVALDHPPRARHPLSPSLSLLPPTSSQVQSPPGAWRPPPRRPTGHAARSRPSPQTRRRLPPGRHRPVIRGCGGGYQRPAAPAWQPRWPAWGQSRRAPLGHSVCTPVATPCPVPRPGGQHGAQAAALTGRRVVSNLFVHSPTRVPHSGWRLAPLARGGASKTCTGQSARRRRANPSILACHEAAAL